MQMVLHRRNRSSIDKLSVIPTSENKGSPHLPGPNGPGPWPNGPRAWPNGPRARRKPWIFDHVLYSQGGFISASRWLDWSSYATLDGGTVTAYAASGTAAGSARVRPDDGDETPNATKKSKVRWEKIGSSRGMYKRKAEESAETIDDSRLRDASAEQQVDTPSSNFFWFLRGRADGGR